MQYIHVKVIAGAKKESLKKKSEDHFTISVCEKAERNMANARVIEIMAGHFGVPASKVRIINRHHHPTKLLILNN